jgi:hypothetical protein
MVFHNDALLRNICPVGDLWTPSNLAQYRMKYTVHHCTETQKILGYCETVYLMHPRHYTYYQYRIS